jgi:hypothetical protein
VALLERAVRVGIRRGLRDGLVGGSRLWLALGAAAVGVRVVQLATARKPVVVTERLAPGEAILVRHFLPGDQ